MAFPNAPALPIDALLPEVLRRLANPANLVVQAAPGAGKTTRVPPALLTLGRGDVLVLEPRRLAARLAARRVAEELGEAVGETVGFQVRFEEVAGPRTRLRYLTEGVLTRRLLRDPTLAGVGFVVLDEFHERHLEGDTCLALLRRLQASQRPDLSLVVMSATLQAADLATALRAGNPLTSEGRLYPLAVRHTPYSADPLEQQVARALERLLGEPKEGDTLVFLPGVAEIRRSMRACEGLARAFDLALLPLYGDLSPSEQDAALELRPRRKVIFSTNVAESSITVPGVRAVIDSGLVRVASHSPWSGLPTLAVQRISQASADQRAGRAARTGPGKVVRLYTEEDLRRRPAYDMPEVEREDLSSILLLLGAMGVEEPAALPWLQAPPPEALDRASSLLERLGAADAAGRLTSLGKRMAQLPLHPRLGRLVLEACARGAGGEGCDIAAALSAGERLSPQRAAAGVSDVLALLDQPAEPGTRRLREQLRRVVRPAPGRAATDEPVLLSILTAFPDRVARRRVQRDEVLLAGNRTARLARDTVVRDAELMVAVEVEERPDEGLPLVRLASAVQPEWLLDLYADRVEACVTTTWNRREERVEAVSALLYDGLVLEESRGPAPAEAAADLLADEAWAAGLDRVTDAEAWQELQARLEFAAAHADLPRVGEEQIREALRTCCHGLRSFKELTAVCAGGGWERAVLATLPPGAARTLDRVAPTRLRLGGRRETRVHYATGQTPWVASRLQDFFGLRETPRVADGRVPLLVHLLAPNQRPVQVTADLEGFWTRLYPQVRRELSRRYPRHAWPEDPLRA